MQLIILQKLESLKNEGWSYYVGWSKDYKGYLCRVWKDRERPIAVKAPGGASVILWTECYSEVAPEIENAIEGCIAKIGRNGWWFEGIPIKPRG